MRKQIFLLAALALSACLNSATAQIRFMKGYFFGNDDQKTECYIRNADWMYNPVSFEWKSTLESTTVHQSQIADVKEFVITDQVRYIRMTVQVDRSSDALADDEMSNTALPEWKQETIFLRELVEGNASLYVYEESGFIRYFYQVGQGPVSQLVYKKYKTKGEPDFHYNEQFRQDLYNQVNCSQHSLFTFESLSYEAQPLVKIFLSHNKCAGGAIKTYKLNTGRKRFEVKPGVGFSSVEFTGNETMIGTPGHNGSFGRNTSPSFGLELEYYMPFLANKWSAFLHGATLDYKGTRPGTTNGAEYATINLNLGIRYGLYLSRNTKVTLHSGIVKDIKISPTVYPEFGTGIAYKRLSLDLSQVLYKSSGSFIDGYSGKLRFTSVALKYSVFSF